MILTITKVYKKERNTKNGPAMSLAVMTKEYGEKWIGGWESELNTNWKIGDQIEATVEQNGQYLNYKIVKPSVAPTAVQTQAQNFNASIRKDDIDAKEKEKELRITRCAVIKSLIESGAKFENFDEIVLEAEKFIDYIINGKKISAEEQAIKDVNALGTDELNVSDIPF